MIAENNGDERKIEAIGAEHPINAIYLCLAAALLVILSSCQPFNIGNLRSVEKAKEAALRTLEKRYGIPFEFVEEYEGEPLDMETYMHYQTSSSFYKEKTYGQVFKPQRYGWQNGLFPIRVMNGLVRPVDENENDGFHTYEVNVYSNSVSDGAFGYIFEDEIKRRIMEVWKKRPENFPFLDKLRIEVRTSDIKVPENIMTMSLEELCPVAYEQDRFAIRVWIYLYLPENGFWGQLHDRFVTSFRDAYEQRRYRFSGEDVDWKTPNERLEKEMKSLEESVREFVHLLKAEPSLKCLYDEKAFEILGRVDDSYLGTHNVVGTDVFRCICDSINTTNSRYSRGIGYWEMETAIVETTWYNFASREEILWHRDDETDEDNGYFQFTGNWNGRLGIKWFKRHRKPAEKKSADEENPENPEGESNSESAENPESEEKSESETEIVEYDDGIDESKIIEKEELTSWVCLDGSPINWVLFVQCHRPVTGIVDFDNGFWDRDDREQWEDYSRLKKVLVTNRANGKQKTVTLRDTKSSQKIDLRDITEPGIMTNVYEMRILDVYKGKKYEAAAISNFKTELAEVKRR